MKGEYTVLIGKELFNYENSDDIPLEFDNLIKFVPEYPPEPHTHDDHELIETFVPTLKEIMKREKR